MSERSALALAQKGLTFVPQEGRALGVIGVLAIFAGQIQNILQTYLPSVGAVTVIDDGLVLLMFVVSLSRLLRAPGLPVVLVSMWFFVLAFAMVATTAYSGFGFDTTFFVFRQVAIPALIILCGMALSRQEWLLICKATVVFAMINVAYVFLEMFVVRPIDPSILAKANGSFIFEGGNPGTYRGNALIGGADVVRAGGLLLNPPTMGIFFAAAAIIVFHTKSMRFRWPMLILIMIALYLTNSRAGILVVIIGIIVPLVASLVGVWFAVGVLTIASIPFAIEIAGQAGSARHSDGLLAGIEDAFANPFGRGFGYVGNHRPEEVVDGAGESLLGIAFSAAGIAAIILVVILLVTYIAQIGRRPEVWESALGLGAIAAALFAETASALNGTVPMWLAAGVAFSLHYRLARDPEFRQEFAVERPPWRFSLRSKTETSTGSP